MAATLDIVFRDLEKRDQEEREALRIGKDQLNKKVPLTKEEHENLGRIGNILNRLAKPKRIEVADPLFVAARDYFNLSGVLPGKTIISHEKGQLRASPSSPLEFDDVVKISLVLGLLAIDRARLPRLTVPKTPKAGDPEVIADPTDPNYGRFSQAFYTAFGEAQDGFELAKLVLSILEDAGDTSADGRTAEVVDTAELAQVMRRLRAKGVTVNEAHLKRRVDECLNEIQGDGVDTPFTDIGISLPDLSDATDYQIQAENVKLMGPIICAAMFDELKAFGVVDKLVELSQNGMLPIGNGRAGKMLYDYWKSTPNRISEAERRNFYALTIGIPGGDGNGNANREFNDLWIRFVSSVSKLVRQGTVDHYVRDRVPGALSQQQVRKAARDLALNLSSHGYGMAFYAAKELRDQIQMMINLLGDPEVMGSYGARDMWQVIDQVATLELGGARNSARYRTLATCGAIITAWLANNVERFNRPAGAKVIDVDEVLSAYPSTAGANATTKPTDYDLVNACELWLADTATSDDRVEELSQPRESPVMTSRPVQIPAIARDMLEQAGVPGLGLGLGMTRH
jgi:hypothetical protein